MSISQDHRCLANLKFRRQFIFGTVRSDTLIESRIRDKKIFFDAGRQTSLLRLEIKLHLNMLIS